MENKSEILFLYETTYNIPNGDPFTGEQRYDEETKQILVSDVRIKRFVRDYIASKKSNNIYIKQKEGAIMEDETEELGNESEVKSKKEGSGSARRIDELILQFKKEIVSEKAKLKKDEPFSEALFVMKQCVDVRLFGGISTKKKDAVNLTGPVQFSLLNPSFNKVDLRIHQNTTCFESRQGKSQGSIATTTLVPYSLLQIHGWVNPKVAEKTGMTEDDLKLMYEGLWYGTSGDGSSHSRSKVGQNSVLLLEIEYAQNNQKIYGVDRLINIETKDNQKGEQLRSMDDYKLNFSKLFAAAATEKIAKIKYYTEIEFIKSEFSGKEKFEEIKFTENKTESK